MTQYLTSKLVADSLLWRETFRSSSPSPEDEAGPGAPLSSPPGPVQQPAPVSAPDPAVLLDIEREARRLAGDVDSLVESLACILQSVSALTVETVQTYRDGVCKTCDQVTFAVVTWDNVLVIKGNIQSRTYSIF